MRLREQSAADGNALTFAARQSVRTARNQRADIEQLDHLVESHRHRARRRATQTEAEIGCHGHVRKQPRILKDKTHASSFRLQPDAGRGVGQHLTIDRDPTLIGAQQSRGSGNDRGLTGTRRPEQHGHTWRRRFERHVHPHRRETMPQPNAQAHRPSIAFSRLAIHSDSSRPISASVSDTSDSSAAFASPPGTCSAV